VWLSNGRTDDARSLLAGVAAEFQAAEYRIDEIETRLLLAEALLALDDVDAVVREVSTALAQAQACGAVRLADKAKATLHELGFANAAVQALPVNVGEQRDASLRPPIDESASDVTGERMVSVMFADVRGYTAMTAEQPPDQIADRIATLQRWAGREVERHHGVVDKFAGDAVMATFNVAGATVDHSLQAVQAAIALRDKAALLDLPLGIGIAVGPAVVGRLARRGNLSVLGEATNLASRLQTQAGVDEVLLSEEAYRRVRPWLEERRLHAVPEHLTVKGLDQPVTAYVLRRQLF
jgi:adenylate cyclase